MEVKFVKVYFTFNINVEWRDLPHINYRESDQ